MSGQLPLWVLEDQVDDQMPTLNRKEWIRTDWRILRSTGEDTLRTQEGPPVDTVMWVDLSW